MLFLKPLRYNIKAMSAPIASPANEINVPCQKPKNKILAAVRNTLGNMPATAMMILKSKLNNKAY